MGDTGISLEVLPRSCWCGAANQTDSPSNKRACTCGHSDSIHAARCEGSTVQYSRAHVHPWSQLRVADAAGIVEKFTVLSRVAVVLGMHRQVGCRLQERPAPPSRVVSNRDSFILPTFYMCVCYIRVLHACVTLPYLYDTQIGVTPEYLLLHRICTRMIR